MIAMGIKDNVAGGLEYWSLHNLSDNYSVENNMALDDGKWSLCIIHRLRRCDPEETHHRAEQQGSAS